MFRSLGFRLRLHGKGLRGVEGFGGLGLRGAGLRALGPLGFIGSECFSVFWRLGSFGVSGFNCRFRVVALGVLGLRLLELREMGFVGPQKLKL